MITRYLALIVAFLATASVARAAPTPIPGGANQVGAVSGAVGQQIWNGALRITVSEVRNATPDEVAQFHPNAGQKVLSFSVLLKNGTSEEFTDLLRYTFADADAISVQVPDYEISHANLHIQQGAAERQVGLFAVDKDFSPVKVLITCATCGAHSPFKSVRLTVPPPAAPAAAPSP